MGSRCIDPTILDLDTIWKWVVSFTPGSLYPRGRTPRYSLDRRLRVLQIRSGRHGEEKNLTAMGTRTPTPRPQNNIFYRTVCIRDFRVSTCNLNKKNLLRHPETEIWDRQEDRETGHTHTATLVSRFITLLADIKIPILPNQYTYNITRYQKLTINSGNK
jgi:hypothetical protein